MWLVMAQRREATEAVTTFCLLQCKQQTGTRIYTTGPSVTVPLDALLTVSRKSCQYNLSVFLICFTLACLALLNSIKTSVAAGSGLGFSLSVMYLG